VTVLRSAPSDRPPVGRTVLAGRDGWWWFRRTPAAPKTVPRPCPEDPERAVGKASDQIADNRFVDAEVAH